MKWNLIIFLGLLVILNFVIVSADYGYNNMGVPQLPPEINYSKLNISAESSDFWDLLDTPTDISGSEFWYNQTQAVFDNEIWINTSGDTMTGDLLQTGGQSLGDSLNFWTNAYIGSAFIDLIDDVTGTGTLIISKFMHFDDIEIWSGGTKTGSWDSATGTMVFGSVGSGITITPSTKTIATNGDMTLDTNGVGSIFLLASGDGDIFLSNGGLPSADVRTIWDTSHSDGEIIYRSTNGVGTITDVFEFQDDILLKDNEKLFLGSGTFGFPSTIDFQAYHDGTNTIFENKQGDLIINSTGIVELSSPTEVKVDTPNLNITGNIITGGNITLSETHDAKIYYDPTSQRMYFSGLVDGQNWSSVFFQFTSKWTPIVGGEIGDEIGTVNRITFGSVQLADNTDFNQGNYNNIFRWDTTGNDYLDWGISAGNSGESGNVVVTDGGLSRTRPAENRPVSVNPTMWWYATTTDDTHYLRWLNNNTNSILESGNGTLYIEGEGLEVEGNLTGNQFYGEMHYHNHTATSLNFATQYENYTLFFTEANNLNGFTYIGGVGESSNLTALVSGTYQANFKSIGDGINNHIYVMGLFINDIGVDECDAHKKMSAGGDILTMNSNCIINLNVGDNINIKVSDDSGTGLGNYYGGSLNLVRIGS